MIKYVVSLAIVLVVLVLAMVLMAANSRNRRVIHQADSLPEIDVIGSRKPLVHSRAKKLSNYIAPFEYCEPAQLLRLAQARRWTLLRQSDTFFHFEAKTAFFGFADDVYFEFDVLSKQIYVCSRSRIGKSDMGTNRRRMEDLRKDLLVNLAKEATDYRSGTELGESQ